MGNFMGFTMLSFETFRKVFDSSRRRSCPEIRLGNRAW